MPKRILIVSDADDPHATAVAYALETKGHRCECLFTPDFPTLSALSMRVDPGDPAGRFLLRAPGVAEVDQSAPFDAVWLRRPAGTVLPEDMHPGDREVAQTQCDVFLAGLCAFLPARPDTFWVNPPASEAVARHKPYHLRLAAAVGLDVPETLFSNDPLEIRAFLRRHGGVAAHKLLETASWLSRDADGAHVYVAYTQPVTEEQLPDDEVLRLCPGIFQPALAKRYEVRVACLGDYLVAARIDSQADARAATDWRVGQIHIGMEPYELPAEVAAGCRRLMRALGLPHGSLDFIVDPEGRHVFLEINPQGQFLFLETRAGLPLLDMWSEFLAAGRRDFVWRDDHRIVRFADYERFWRETGRGQAARHARYRKPLGAPDGASVPAL
jgi:hypothetical protein